MDLHHTFSGAIPENYDKYLGPAWFVFFARDLALRLPPDPGGDALEIACGTGLATRPLRERLDPRRKLVATDLSAPMLAHARSRLGDLQGIEWREADALHLPFAPATFGAVLCSFGVMFVPDRVGLLREVQRVLRPGGLFVFNVWDRIEANTCAHVYAQTIESLFPGDAEVRFRVPYEMHDEAALRAVIAEAGFRLRELTPVEHTVSGVTAREVATGQVLGTPRGLLLAKRGMALEDAVERVAQALSASCPPGAPFGGRCRALAVVAEA